MLPLRITDSLAESLGPSQWWWESWLLLLIWETWGRTHPQLSQELAAIVVLHPLYIWDFIHSFARPIEFLWTSPENHCGNCCVARRSVGIARIASLILIEWAAVFAALSRKKPLSHFIHFSNCSVHSYSWTWESKCSEEAVAGTQCLFLQGQRIKQGLFVLD